MRIEQIKELSSIGSINNQLYLIVLKIKIMTRGVNVDHKGRGSNKQVNKLFMIDSLKVHVTYTITTTYPLVSVMTRTKYLVCETVPSICY